MQGYGVFPNRMRPYFERQDALHLNKGHAKHRGSTTLVWAQKAQEGSNRFGQRCFQAGLPTSTQNRATLLAACGLGDAFETMHPSPVQHEQCRFELLCREEDR